MTQTVNIAQISIAEGTVADIKIDEITLGGVTIGQLTLQGTSLDVTSGSASLGNVRIVITLDFSFDWWINLGFWSHSGSANIGSLSFGLNLGNVSIPSLTQLPLEVPNVVLSNLSTVVAPLMSMDLGEGAFSGMTATNLVLPKNGLTLGGLGLGSVSIAGVQVPEATAAQVAIQDFHPNAKLVLPSATLGPIQIPSASAASIQATTAISFTGDASQQGAGLNLGVLGGTINVTPTALVSIGSLLLQGATLSGSVTQAILTSIGVPVDVRGINLSAIDIGQINVNNITI